MNTKNQIILVVVIIATVAGAITMIAVLNSIFLNMNKGTGFSTFKLSDEPVLPLVEPQYKDLCDNPANEFACKVWQK